MKEKEITTGKGKFLLKEMMPEVVEFEAKRIVINGKTYHSIGKVVTLTEEQWKGIVDAIDSEDLSYGYERYMSDDDFSNSDRVEACSTTTESGLSLLKANGIVLENSFGEEPKLSDYIFEEHIELVGNPKEYDHELFHKGHDEWEKAQQQVWSNAYLFAEL